jgi:hypothetical protein
MKLSNFVLFLLLSISLYQIIFSQTTSATISQTTTPVTPAIDTTQLLCDNQFQNGIIIVIFLIIINIG